MHAGAVKALDRLGGDAGATRSTRILMQALLELRGAALKIAQFLCLEHDVLTPQAAAEIGRACHRVPPMGPEFARHAIRSALGPIERHFASFDPVPFAAASLGQVHAARTLDGLDVAVKIQYPGIAQTVRSDLALLRRGAALLPRAPLHAHVVEEIESRLLEECDYVQEAAAQAWFAQHLHVDGVMVAAVQPALSNRQVLTSERLPGLHLEDWVSGVSQPARNRAAQALFDVFAQSLRELGRLHGDPQAGNVLFQPDGGVALLDFGCTRWLPADVVQMIVRLLRAVSDGDDVAARAVHLDMGLAPTSPAVASSLLEFGEWVAQPLRVAEFDFGADCGFLAEGRRRFVQLWQDDLLTGLRPEFVLVNRALYGLYRLFERLGARVRCQSVCSA